VRALGRTAPGEAVVNGAHPASRHFVAVADRDVHYRRSGSGAPVVLLHESPLSSLHHEPLAQRLGTRFTALALDTPGYGSSDPLPQRAPAIADYAAALTATLDALGIERCGLYGAHTGAAIALEVAVRAPRRVAALVLDGLLLPTEDERRELLERYCPAFAPTLDGGHLIAAWTMRRDMHLFFPWYRRCAEASLALELPDAPSLHRGMLEFLRAGSAYHRGYDAAFRYEAGEALRALEVPTAVIASESDVLFAHLGRVPADVPANVNVCARPADADAAADAIATHLAAAQDEPPPPPARSPPRPDRLTRSYATTRFGALHLRARAGGSGRPLVLIHGSPTSAAMLEPLQLRLARSRPVYAFDTLGNGDSDKPDAQRHARFEAPEIADFAAVLAEAIDDVGLERFDLYGTHTGAAIAIETSLLRPGRVGRIILDGVAMFDATSVAEFLERYFIDTSPRTDGTHLLSAWACARDSTIWFPWYRRDPAHRYRSDVYDADALHRYVVEFLKSGTSYPLPYRAAFTYPAQRRLPLLSVTTLIAAHREDPLAPFLEPALAACPVATATVLPDDPEATAALFERFLDDGGSA
jgi:pimeloyl-ACP methyl ester carboxylesterase